MGSINPHEKAYEKSAESMRRAFLIKAITSTTPDNQGDGLHNTSVQEVGTTVERHNAVMPTVHGDYYVPPENSPVFVASTGKHEHTVIGAPVPEAPTPSIVPGERVLSHPLSSASITFLNDGSIRSRSDEGAARTRLYPNGTIVADANGGAGFLQMNGTGDIDIEAGNGTGTVEMTAGGDITITANSSTIEMQSDGTIVINGGTEGAITDVEAADTNSNGGITSLDITREDSILI